MYFCSQVALDVCDFICSKCARIGGNTTINAYTVIDMSPDASIPSDTYLVLGVCLVQLDRRLSPCGDKSPEVPKAPFVKS